ncbi:hypothetical protein C2G38_2181719 [Gigaspora rosea]|uniref:Uncharacterized protein n=1 Tax=Gigaspora rosea TaxID=44941 RepID=A0A397VJX5_9GLOM|nr:hypothetical protein C2G38_2181719 [Gigaspora rosea]
MRKEACQYFKQEKFLEALELYEEIIKNQPYSAKDLKFASTWDLTRKCGLEKLNDLIKALCKNSTLTSLDILRENGIGSERGEAFANILCKNNTLTSLELSFNNISYRTCPFNCCL